MTEEPNPPPPPVSPSESAHTGTGLGDELRSLRRSRTDRKVAGVLGGLGQRLGIDPLVLRIAIVVLALFGGIGMMLYALGWLLIPEEGADGSVAEQALGRRPGGAHLPTVLLAVALAIAVLVTAGGTFGSWDASILLVLAIVGLFFALRRGGEGGGGGQPAERPGAPTGDVSDGSFDYPGLPGYAPPFAPDTEAGEHNAVSDSASGWPDGPDWDRPEPEPAPRNPYPAAGQVIPRASKPPRSILGPVTVSVAAVVLGALAISDAMWADVPFAAYVAAALAVVGAGLLAGAWFGRSRGLIVLGLILALALPPAIYADRYSWETGRFRITPTSVAAVPAGLQEHGAGSSIYDLSEIDFTEVTGPVDLTVKQGVGELRVILPPDVDARISAEVGLGELELFGTSYGPGSSRETLDYGDDDHAGGGEIDLDLKLGLGHLQVSRADTPGPARSRTEVTR